MLSVANGVYIYPNPTNGIFTIQINVPVENGEVEITNMIGQVVYKRAVVLGSNAVKITGLAKGVYNYMLIEKGQASGLGKLVIE